MIERFNTALNHYELIKAFINGLDCFPHVQLELDYRGRFRVIGVIRPASDLWHAAAIEWNKGRYLIGAPYGSENPKHKQFNIEWMEAL